MIPRVVPLSLLLLLPLAPACSQDAVSALKGHNSRAPVDVAADRKGEQIHLVPHLARRLEHLAERDGGAAVLVERLRGDHEDPARSDPSGAGEPPCTGPFATRLKPHAWQGHGTVRANN